MRTYFRSIVFFVIAVHLGLIAWIIIIEFTTPQAVKPYKQKLVVKTVSVIDPSEMILQPISFKEQKENPSKIQLKKKEEQKVPKKDPIKPQTKEELKVPKKDPIKPQKKEPIVEKLPSNKAVKKDTSTKKKADPSPKVVSPNLMKDDKKTSKMQENIAKIRKNLNKSSFSNKSNGEVADLGEIIALNIDSAEITARNEANYYDALVSCLKRGLVLPELGEVKVNITIDQKGKVLKLETLQSKSAWNKQYLEKQLPTLTMPTFELYYKGITQKTFTITLTNDI